MSIYQIKETTLTNIANKIRSKLGVNKEIKVDEMANDISSIPSVKEDVFMILDGEDSYDLITHFNTEVSSYNGNKVQGNRSLMIKPKKPVGQNDKVGAMALYTPQNSMDLSKYKTISVDLFVSEAQAGSRFQINFATEGEDGYNWIFRSEEAGWMRLVLDMETMIKAVESADWSSINAIRLTYINTQQTSTNVYFLIDNLVAY